MGATALDLNKTKLTDPLGQPIPHEAFDGYLRAVVQDIAVTKVIPSARLVYQGWTAQINVTVKNEGDLTETFNVVVYADKNVTVKGDEILIGNQTVPSYQAETPPPSVSHGIQKEHNHASIIP